MKKTFIQIFFPLIIILSISETYARKVVNNEYIIKQLKIEDGLSQSSILSILQDQKGYMWFGTGSGLNRYDGYSFKVYLNDPTDSLSLSDNGISALFEDKDGFMWVGTSGGYLNKFDRKTEKFERIDLNLFEDKSRKVDDNYFEYPLLYSRNSDNSVTTISEDHSGKIWVGTWGHGVFIYDKHKKSLLNLRHSKEIISSLSYNRVTKILTTKNGDVWVATFGGGLNKLMQKNKINSDNDFYLFQKFGKSKSNNYSLNDDKVTSLFESENGTLWIGTYYGGLNKLKLPIKNFDSSKIQFEHWVPSVAMKDFANKFSIMAITEDDSNFLWVGTFGNGLNRINLVNNTVINFQHNDLDENSIADNDIISLFKDKSGIIWAGTHLGEGISQLTRQSIKFNIIKSIPGSKLNINDNVIWSILQDKENILWIGTYRGGLNRIDEVRNKITYFKNSLSKNSLSDNHVRSLIEDKFGNIWIGTYSGGLNRLDKATSSIFRFMHNPQNSLSIGGNQIQKLYIDSNSTLWIAVFGGGLNALDLNDLNFSYPSFKKYKHNPSDSLSISDNRVYTIYEDRNSNFWVGTFGGGLNKLNKKDGTFKRYRYDYRNPFSLQNDKILCIYEDKADNFWLGSSGSGLLKFDRTTERFTAEGYKYNIDADVIYGILEDEQNNLWLSTSNGIYKYSYLIGRVVHYDVQDGVQSLEFSGGAYFKSGNGEMFFGGINGLNRFFPTQVKDDSFIPPIVITSIKINNQIVKGERGSLSLNYHENFLTIEFAALSFSNPLNNSYSYILEGFDENWENCDAKYRMATYTNLPPGKYIFRVRGSNHDGVWNPIDARIQILIHPPFWKTWWFITLTVVFAVAAIYTLSSIHYRNKLRIEKLKTKLAADLHDNIGSGLTEISILSEIAQSDYDCKREPNVLAKLRSISETARQLIDNMSDIVWVVNPDRDSLNDLLVRLKDSYSDILSSYGISFKISNLDKLNNLTLPMEYRQNLYLIFKEAINNSIKHSKCKKLLLQANVRSNVLELVLYDDGVGCDLKHIERGNGIRNMDLRSKNIGGKLKWSSVPLKGTTVRFIGQITNRNVFKKLF
ncbi:MAG: hypothetical protein HXY50_12310 [Ignavibacteriaceae bacterium]|nr:hypothetical protein [Ignavibacteriaceae bacterium]